MKRIIYFLLVLFPVGSALGQSEGTDEVHTLSGGDESISYSVNQKSNIIEYPFGYSHPVLKCAQLRYSRIVLQEGETINNIIIGDERRWMVTKSWQGETGKTKPIILVKPRHDDVTTNLLVFTSKRTYDVTLIAEGIQEGETNPNEDFTRAITFYYPNEESVTGNETIPQPVADNSESDSSDSSNEVNHDEGRLDLSGDDVNLDYDVEKGKHGFPWEPQLVYDNGRHTFIVLPPEASEGPLPTLYEVNEAGEKQMVNVAFSDDSNIMKVDRLFHKAVFIKQFRHPGFLGLKNVTDEKELFITRN